MHKHFCKNPLKKTQTTNKKKIFDIPKQEKGSKHIYVV